MGSQNDPLKPQESVEGLLKRSSFHSGELFNLSVTEITALIVGLNFLAISIDTFAALILISLQVITLYHAAIRRIQLQTQWVPRIPYI